MTSALSILAAPPVKAADPAGLKGTQPGALVNRGQDTTAYRAEVSRFEKACFRLVNCL
jgi:hypothetical protein